MTMPAPNNFPQQPDVPTLISSLRRQARMHQQY